MTIALATIWFSAGESYRVRFLSTFVEGIADEYGQRGADASAQGRLAGLQMGFSTFLKRPAVGIGPGNFKYAWAGGTGEILGGSSHNLYGQLLGELGACGALAFSLMIGIFLWTHNKVRRRANTFIKNLQEAPGQNSLHKLLCLRLIPIACLQGILLLLFNGNFGHNLYRFNYLWIGAMGVVASCLVKQRETNDSPVEQDTPLSLQDAESDTHAKPPYQ